MIPESFKIDRSVVEEFLALDPDAWERLNADYTARRRIGEACRALTRHAFVEEDPSALEELHDVLTLIYQQDFSGAPVELLGCETQPVLRDIAAILEGAVLAAELDSISEEQISAYPRSGKEYVHWLKRIIGEHPAAGHPFYRDFVPTRATEGDFRFYLAQETNLDPKFDDILAFMQIGAAPDEKMEIAGNYWDEMGNGKPAEVHTAMFAHALDALDVNDDYIRRNLLPEAKASGNLASCLAISRRHYYKSVGFFGVTEYLVPRRFKLVVDRWADIGLPREGIAYHDAHISIDAVHASGWFKNVIAPAVDRDPRVGREIAVGALIRLNSSQRYLDSLLMHLHHDSAAHTS
ncbi:iron-containing redox enzyme family protein [Streptomyces fungicidicus]|uniref:iron-containing redox enzyme family protein n=1 Tax=Streptomyces fungicidicus TaxID=68203 RepID=UPI0036A1B333